MTAPAVAGSITGAAASAGGASSSWLDFEHPHVKAMRDRWTFALDHYTGELLLTSLITQYLVRRLSGEPLQSYQERQRIADYQNHYGAVVDSLAGMLFANEEATTRVWAKEGAPGLGDEQDPKSVAGQLMRDADGRGLGWTTLHKRLVTRLLTLQELWGLVTSPGGHPRLTYLDPTQVVDWVEDHEGRLTMVKLKESVLDRANLQTAPKPMDRWTVYELDGWKRYRKTEQGGVEQLGGDENVGTYQFQDAAGVPQLPIFRVQLPLARYVGWTLAKSASNIFNLTSGRDFQLWTASFAKLKLAAGNTLYDKIVADLEQGANILQDDPQYPKTHDYIAPPVEPVSIANAVIDKKVVDFYITAFREYGDAARERTATEARQDVAAGVGALLQLLKSAVDDAENAALWRIEQTQFPEMPARWFVARTERSDEFLPVDVNAVIDRLTTRYFGKDVPVPIGRAGRLSVARQIANYEGIEVADHELQRAIDAQTVLDLLEVQALKGLDLPADARTELALRLAEALGLVAPLSDQTDAKPPLERAQLKAAILELAAAHDKQARDLASLAGEFRPQPPEPPADLPPAPPTDQA